MMIVNILLAQISMVLTRTPHFFLKLLNPGNEIRVLFDSPANSVPDVTAVVSEEQNMSSDFEQNDDSADGKSTATDDFISTQTHQFI